MSTSIYSPAYITSVNQIAAGVLDAYLVSTTTVSGTPATIDITGLNIAAGTNFVIDITKNNYSGSSTQLFVNGDNVAGNYSTSAAYNAAPGAGADLGFLSSCRVEVNYSLGGALSVHRPAGANADDAQNQIGGWRKTAVAASVTSIRLANAGNFTNGAVIKIYTR